METQVIWTWIGRKFFIEKLSLKIAFCSTSGLEQCHFQHLPNVNAVINKTKDNLPSYLLLLENAIEIIGYKYILVIKKIFLWNIKLTPRNINIYTY